MNMLVRFFPMNRLIATDRRRIKRGGEIIDTLQRTDPLLVAILKFLLSRRFLETFDRQVARSCSARTALLGRRSLKGYYSDFVPCFIFGAGRVVS